MEFLRKFGISLLFITGLLAVSALVVLPFAYAASSGNVWVGALWGLVLVAGLSTAIFWDDL